MDGDLRQSDTDINLDELDGILTFEDSDIDLTDDINIYDLNDGLDVIPLYVDEGRDIDKQDEIWVEGEGGGDESDGMVSIHSSDDETRTRWHVFNAERDMKEPKFYHGMLFTNKEVLKRAIYKVLSWDDYEPTCYLPVQPLPVNVKKGITQKRRRKTIDEHICKIAKDGTKFVGNTGQVKGNCSKCGGQGHNKRTCGRQISQRSVREDYTEEGASTLVRRSKLTVRRRIASTSQEITN